MSDRPECVDPYRDRGDREAGVRERLMASEECYRLLFEHHPQPMAIYEPASLRFLDVNEAAVALYGYSRVEFLGMTVHDLSLWPAAADVVAIETESAVQKHARKDRTPIDVEVSSRALPLSELPVRLLVIRDQTDRLRVETERKILEARFRQSQKLEPVRRLAGGIAHDFNNLLTILLGYAEWLETREGHDPQFTAAAREIHEATASASVLVHQLLAFSRREVARPRIDRGAIAVDSTDETGETDVTGTCFKIDFPYVPKAAARVDDTPPLLRVAGGDEWILVVEDDARLRSLAEQILETRGYQVLSAAHAREALALIDTHGAKLSLLLTDVVLPDTNGRVLANRALKKCPTLSVIYMSGYTDASAIDHGGDTPQAFLGKPFTAVGLLELVRSTLDTARARALAKTADESKVRA